MKKGQLFISILIILGSIMGACAPNTSAIKPPLTFEIPDTELPLSELGPYDVSILNHVDYVDARRDNREVSTFIVYPSVDDQPDVRGAPFPLIICDHKMANKFGDQMASHGYVVSGIRRIDTYDPWDESLINQPLDYIFVLNQLAENPPETLIGIIDTDHVGVWGYSFGGRNSLFLTGARVDPDYYLEICENPENSEIDYAESTIITMCGPYLNWDGFTQNAGLELTDSDDGFWLPITDDRILALIPMSGKGEWLFGPEGLAAADKAIIITAGTNEGTRYEEGYRIFEELGTSEKIFISFVDQGHMMVFSQTPNDQMRHIAIAFFSYHLKGREEYAQYFSEDYISQIEGLAWGWYEE